MMPETTAVDLAHQPRQRIVGGVAHTPALPEETGTAPNCEDAGKMRVGYSVSKETVVVRPASVTLRRFATKVSLNEDLPI